MAEGERERERESVEQQSKHALIPIYNKNKKQTNFYFKFSPMRALSRPARSAGFLRPTKNRPHGRTFGVTVGIEPGHVGLLFYVLYIVNCDTILSPSCTVRCPGATKSLVLLSLYFHVVFGRNPVGLRFAAKVYNVIGVNTLQHTPRVEPVVAILYRCFAVVPLQPRVV